MIWSQTVIFFLCNLWTHVRESRTILESGFQVADSGFQELDSDCVSVELGFRVSIAFGIPDSKAQLGFPDSGNRITFHGWNIVSAVDLVS